MTDAPPLAPEQITQEDREAAATLVPLCFGASDLWKSNVLAGYYDDGEVVQAFARHRIAALSATPAPSDQDASQAQGEVRLRHAAQAVLDSAERPGSRAEYGIGEDGKEVWHDYQEVTQKALDDLTAALNAPTGAVEKGEAK